MEILKYTSLHIHQMKRFTSFSTSLNSGAKNIIHMNRKKNSVKEKFSSIFYSSVQPKTPNEKGFEVIKINGGFSYIILIAEQNILRQNYAG